MKNLTHHVLLNFFQATTGAPNPAQYRPLADLERDMPEIARRLELHGAQINLVKQMLRSYARDLERISRRPLEFRMIRQLRATQLEMEGALMELLSSRQLHAYRNWRNEYQIGGLALVTHAN